MAAEWNKATQKYDHKYAITWAIIDPAKETYTSESLLDRSSPQTMRKQLLESREEMDPRIKRAYMEVPRAAGAVTAGSLSLAPRAQCFDSNKVPLPDKMFPEGSTVVAPMDRLALNYGGNTFTKEADGSYTCVCHSAEKKVGFTLRLTPKKKVMRHGKNGVVSIGLKGDEMFYYFIPRCDAVGTVTMNGETKEVSGLGWYDHEFGGKIRSGRTEEEEKMFARERSQLKGDYGWNWLACQLEDGTDISATTVVDAQGNLRVLENFAIVMGPGHDNRQFYNSEGVRFAPLNKWISIKTALNVSCARDHMLHGIAYGSNGSTPPSGSS